MFSLFGASWAKNSADLAKSLSLDPSMNVTFLGSYEQEADIKREVELGKIQMLSLPHKMVDSYPPMKGSIITEMYTL